MTASGVKSNWGVRALVAALALLVIWYVFFYRMRPVAVVSAVVSERAFKAVPGSVEVKAEYTMELKSEVGGRIIKSELDPGKKVFKGDVLVQIDTGDIDLVIEGIRNEITAAKRRVELGSTLKADVENLRDTVAILERQTKAGSFSESEMEKQRRSLKQAEQKMELDEVAMKLALEINENALRTKLREKEKMTIVAPTNGVIASINVNARAGDLIGRDFPIATLISSTRTIEAKVSEENFAGILPGQKASIRFLGYGSTLYNAKVTKILPTANAETQRYIVHLSVELEVERLVPGLTGEVNIVLGERDAETVIPRRALRGGEVMVVKGGTVEVRKVKLGYVASNKAEILEGLKKGEQVIVEELDRFQPGDRVRVKLSK